MGTLVPSRLAGIRVRNHGKVLFEVSSPEQDPSWVGVEIDPRDVGLVVSRRELPIVEAIEATAGTIAVIHRRNCSDFFPSKLQAIENAEWLVRGPRDEGFNVRVLGVEGNPFLACGSRHARLLHLSNVLGEVVLSFDGIQLPILCVSSKLPGPSPAASVRALLEWVWSRHVELIRSVEGVCSLPLAAGRRRGRSPAQVMMLLDYLLGPGGVELAWASLLSEPRRSLAINWPAVHVSRATHPAWHGPRNPWSIPGGLDPSGQPRRVRNRTPIRKVDTLPMRLGKRLAHRTAELASGLRSKFLQLGALGWSERAARVHRIASQAESHPEWESVSLSSPLPLDAPQLQLDPATRPLLRAWLLLESGLAFQDWDDILFREPLRHSYELYEYAVWFAIVESLRSRSRQYSFVRVPIKQADDVVASASIPWGLRAEFALVDGRHASLSYNATTGATPALSSWSVEFRPDYVLTIGDALHVLDAKYRVDQRDGTPQPDDVKAMHAYRDAIRGPAGQRVRTGAIIFPGTGTVAWTEPGTAHVGLAAVPWSPPTMRGSRARPSKTHAESALDCWMDTVLNSVDGGALAE
jgi:hypothetical protein